MVSIKNERTFQGNCAVGEHYRKCYLMGAKPEKKEFLLKSKLTDALKLGKWQLRFELERINLLKRNIQIFTIFRIYRSINER